jgi:TonB family protein
VDRSFQGLVLSLCLHAVLVWILVHTDAPSLSQNETAEILLIERDEPPQKRRAVVTETEKQPNDPATALKEQADLLSQFTKRVKNQVRARETGRTQNRQAAQAAQGDPEGIAGERTRGQGDGFLRPGGGQAMRNIAIGPSTIAEYIPGVQEGAFTALNTDQFTYYSFFERMNEQVRNRWIALVREYMASITRRDLEFMSRAERHTTVEIILSPAGEFVNSLLHTTSGDRHLDQTTVEAFRRAAPFPNPPRGMVENDGFIRLRYSFVVHFRPPSLSPGPQ